jgi:hypothetical protein
LNFNNLPQIKAYYEKPTAFKLPFIPPNATINIKLPGLKLGYWNNRGRGQVPRLLLTYLGI